MNSFLHPFLSLSWFVAILLLSSLSSCTYYRWLPIDSSSPQAWETGLTAKEKQEVLILLLQDQTEQTYQLVDPAISGQEIQGTLQRLPNPGIPNKGMFRQAKLPSDAEGMIRQTLFVRTALALEEGPFSMPAEAGSLYRYRKASGVNFWTSATLVAGSGFLALVGIVSLNAIL